MSNTKVTITYANGSIREFVASDNLEQMINEGHMFSVTTMHSDMGVAEEMLVSKMYVGNPVAAMGHMMMMLRNAQTMRKSKSNRIVKQVLTACIKLMSDEITSFQSEMSPVDTKPDLKLVKDTSSDIYTCLVIGEPCEHIVIAGLKGPNRCTHSDNSRDGDCTDRACPLHEDFVPF
jgi:hypothetical protein